MRLDNRRVDLALHLGCQRVTRLQHDTDSLPTAQYVRALNPVHMPQPMFKSRAQKLVHCALMIPLDTGAESPVDGNVHFVPDRRDVSVVLSKSTKHCEPIQHVVDQGSGPHLLQLLQTFSGKVDVASPAREARNTEVGILDLGKQGLKMRQVRDGKVSPIACAVRQSQVEPIFV